MDEWRDSVSLGISSRTRPGARAIPGPPGACQRRTLSVAGGERSWQADLLWASRPICCVFHRHQKEVDHRDCRPDARRFRGEFEIRGDPANCGRARQGLRHRHCRRLLVRQHGGLLAARARLRGTLRQGRTQHRPRHGAQGPGAHGGARERRVRAFVRNGQSRLAERGYPSRRVAAATGAGRGGGGANLRARLHHRFRRRV